MLLDGVALPVAPPPRSGLAGVSASFWFTMRVYSQFGFVFQDWLHDAEPHRRRARNLRCGWAAVLPAPGRPDACARTRTAGGHVQLDYTPLVTTNTPYRAGSLHHLRTYVSIWLTLFNRFAGGDRFNAFSRQTGSLLPTG